MIPHDLDANAVQAMLAMAAETHPPDAWQQRWRESRDQGLPLLSIWDFVLAADTALTDPPASREFRASVLSELFRKLPADAPARGALLECAEAWSATWQAPDLAEQLLTDWRSLTFPEDDFLALERLLRLGDRLGLFAQDSALDERIGQNALGPAMLDHPDWANAFAQALRMPAARDLWRGVMRSFSFQEAACLQPLDPTLQREELTRELEALALELQNPWLFSFLTIRRDLADPVRAFSDGFARVAEAFESLPRADLLRTAFMAAWGMESPGFGAALAAIEVMKAQGFGLSACGLLRDFEQALDRGGAFEDPDRQQSELVAAMVAELPEQALGSFPVLEAYAWLWPRLSEGSLDSGEVDRLDALLGKLPARGAATQDKLLTALADRLLAGTLDVAPDKPLPPAVLARLCTRHADRLASDPPDSPKDWAQAFIAARVLGQKHPDEASSFERAFMTAFEAWRPRKDPWKAVSRALAAAGARSDKQNWDQLRADRSRRVPQRSRKFLGGAMSVGLMGLALLAVAVGLVLVVQRLDPPLTERFSPGLGREVSGPNVSPSPEEAEASSPAEATADEEHEPMPPIYFDTGVPAPEGSTRR